MRLDAPLTKNYSNMFIFRIFFMIACFLLSVVGLLFHFSLFIFSLIFFLLQMSHHLTHHTMLHWKNEPLSIKLKSWTICDTFIEIREFWPFVAMLFQILWRNFEYYTVDLLNRKFSSKCKQLLGWVFIYQDLQGR